MREYYLPQFRAAVQAGSSTIMINSGDDQWRAGACQQIFT